MGGKHPVRNLVERECTGDMDIERARVDQAVKLVGGVLGRGRRCSESTVNNSDFTARRFWTAAGWQ